MVNTVNGLHQLNRQSALQLGSHSHFHTHTHLETKSIVALVVTEYFMSDFQAPGYQADPDHAAQLSHHGESFSF